MSSDRVSSKVVVVMPAYNVGRVVGKAIAALPKGCADEIIVVDDCSSDDTSAVAQRLGCHVVRHPRNRGYGGSQKTGYREAIARGADFVVMVHGDNQYDPSFAVQFVGKLRDEGYDVVTGTRIAGGGALRGGMPLWKYVPNRFLTWLENTTFRTNLSDYHNGYRAYRVSFLKQVPLELLSEKFDFDTDIIIQAAVRRTKIAEIPHPTRYEDENSQMSFSKGVHYGLSILRTIALYLLHRSGLRRNLLFTEELPR